MKAVAVDPPVNLVDGSKVEVRAEAACTRPVTMKWRAHP